MADIMTLLTSLLGSDGYKSNPVEGKLSLTALNQQIKKPAELDAFFMRDPEGRMQVIRSDWAHFRSRRDVDTGPFWGSWNPKRIAVHVPLQIERPAVSEFKTSEDFDLLPAPVKALFQSGAILRTSTNPNSDFSVLMYATDDTPPAGRTGILYYLGQPVIVTASDQDYIVEIKGVGMPNGQNDYAIAMWRNSIFGSAMRKQGGLEPHQGLAEFANLESLRLLNTEEFQNGLSPRALMAAVYDGGVDYQKGNTNQGYLLRLAPGSIRASFEAHEVLPVVEDRTKKMAQDFAKGFAHLMLLPGTMIHVGLHTENFILTPQGYKFTDYSDIVPLNAFKDPFRELFVLLESFVSELLDSGESDRLYFYEQLAQHLGVKLHDEPKVRVSIYHQIWDQFLAPRVFAERFQKGVYKALAEIIEAIDFYRQGLASIDDNILAKIQGFINNLQLVQERDSWELSLAETKLKELQKLIGDTAGIKKYFSQVSFVTSEHASNYLKDQILCVQEQIDALKKKLSDQEQKEKEFETIGLNPKKLAGFDRKFYVAGLRIKEALEAFLQQEVKLLQPLNKPAAVQSLKKAQNGLAYLASVQNPYEIVERVREQPDFLDQLVTMPYITYQPTNELYQAASDTDLSSSYELVTFGVELAPFGGLIEAQPIGMNLIPL